MHPVFAIVLFIVVALIAPMANAARVGVIAQDSELANVGDLLTASLSKQPNIVVVERAEMDKLAKERALTYGQAAEVGKLLGADALVFLALSGSGSNQVATIRLVAAK